MSDHSPEPWVIGAWEKAEEGPEGYYEFRTELQDVFSEAAIYCGVEPGTKVHWYGKDQIGKMVLGVVGEYSDTTMELSDADMARIVACVNACAGMADPEDEIALMRKVNDRLCDQTMEISNLQEDCEAKDAEIERLKGAGTDERVERAMRQVARLRAALDAISESYWRSACELAEKRLTAAAAECNLSRKLRVCPDEEWAGVMARLKNAMALTDKFGGPGAWCDPASPEAPQDETEEE